VDKSPVKIMIASGIEFNGHRSISDIFSTML
jgi:hypothetical protein